MLDEAHEGLLALDENGRIVEANVTAAALLGHEQRRLIGKPLAALVALTDRRRLRQTLARLEPGAQTRLPVTLLRGTGIEMTLRALPRSTPRRVAVTLTGDAPITVEVVSRSARDRLEYFLLRFPHAVVTIRKDMHVAFANGRARALLGRDAVRAGTVFGDNTSADIAALARKLTQVPAPLGTTDIEQPDGRIFRVTGLAATDEDPAVLLIEDVTTPERSARVMREFLRNAAHQLRTPLAGITSAVEMLQSGAKERPGDRDLFLDHIATHSQRLARLARGLLLLARTEAGGSLPLDYVELGPLLEEVTENAEAEPGVDIRAECEPGLAAVAEPDLLQEAVTALVDNAIQHTRDGEIRVTAARANGGVVLRVTDTGAGILPEFQDRLFEPFFRLAPSGEGYGLGLAIAAQAVRAMHGKIDVSSTPGSGTVFTVHLPSAGVTR